MQENDQERNLVSSENDAGNHRALIKRAITDGFSAARRNRAAGVALWLFGCAIIAGYYLVPPVNLVLEQVAAWRVRWSFFFSAVSTGLFGGLIPSLIQIIYNRLEQQKMKPHLVSNFLFWALKGIEIDLLYRGQAALFGDRADGLAVAIKTAVDQFIYVPLIGLLNVILFYLWRDCGYDIGRFRQTLGQHWYRERVLPVLIANWLIWIPAVVLIYCFPLALQLPVQNLILCFWILLLTVLTHRTTARS